MGRKFKIGWCVVVALVFLVVWQARLSSSGKYAVGHVAPINVSASAQTFKDADDDTNSVENPAALPDTGVGTLPPRNVYIDMGANWANTLRLYKDVGGDKGPWEVYAFEASPLIQPYVEDFTKWLNGKGPRPEVKVPPSGSSTHLRQIGIFCGCEYQQKEIEKLRQCMMKRFEPELNALEANPDLKSAALIKERLAEAATPLSQGSGDRFTFIPAAVGDKDGSFELSKASAKQAIRGGASAKDRRLSESSSPGDSPSRVPVVNVVTWLEKNFREEDYIFLKMDVEGAEHGIFKKLLATGGGALIDKLAYECHGSAHVCGDLKARLRAKTKATFMIEEKGSTYYGYDSFSAPEVYYPDSCKANDPAGAGSAHL